MAGILDKKTRFIDLVITQEGKRQIASGELRAEFASLTDMHADYEKNNTNSDFSDRIYFEVAERPENSIVLEKNDSGRIIQQDVVDGLVINDNNIVALVSSDVGLNEQDEPTRIKSVIATGSQFASLSDSLIDLSINHLNKTYLISTDLFENHDKFTLNKESIEFTISNSIPFALGPEREIVNINDTDSFIQDKKMANLNNFSFLPPVNENGTPYGNYTDIRNLSALNFNQIISKLGLQAFSEIEKEESEAYNVKKNTSGDLKIYNREDESNFENFIKKEYETIKFLNTSIENNLMIQIFETNESKENTENSNKITKLDIIDGGFFSIDGDVNNRNEKQVYYAGKIFYDQDNIAKFINLFTIIFD